MIPSRSVSPMVFVARRAGAVHARAGHARAPRYLARRRPYRSNRRAPVVRLPIPFADERGVPCPDTGDAFPVACRAAQCPHDIPHAAWSDQTAVLAVHHDGAPVRGRDHVAAGRERLEQDAGRALRERREHEDVRRGHPRRQVRSKEVSVVGDAGIGGEPAEGPRRIRRDRSAYVEAPIDSVETRQRGSQLRAALSPAEAAGEERS